MHSEPILNSRTTGGTSGDALGLPPEGLLVDRRWLSARGVGRPTVDYYVRSGRLVSVARGLYRRPGPPLKWQHVVYSLGELGYRVHVGGRSALELRGLAHFLPMGGVRRIDLFTERPLPRWVAGADWPVRFIEHRTKLFADLPAEALTSEPFGHWDWPIPFAAWELALVELAAEVRDAQDFDYADKLFEGASVLRPELLRTLLLSCRSVRAKRVFLWFARRHGHDWTRRLDTADIDLGRGKRMLVRGGVLDKEFLITVPREMAHDDRPLF